MNRSVFVALLLVVGLALLATGTAVSGQPPPPSDQSEGVLPPAP
jgi:hypothetical protein